MTFEVEVGGRRRAVSIERTAAGRQFQVLLDGASYQLDALPVGDSSLSLLGDKGTKVPVPFSHQLMIAKGDSPGEWLVSLRGRTTTALVNGRRRGAAAVASAHATGEVAIVAPMPGRVVRVLVTEGEQVTAKQGLIVVEAMKMENELRAPRAGRVKAVGVAAGTSVEAGRLLAVIE